MTTHSNIRAMNGQRQFVLPAIPASTSPALAALVAEYQAGFVAIPEEEHPRWGAAAEQIHNFEPASIADLAAKLIIAIHYRDPETSKSELAIDAPEAAIDRLAAEMELRCLDWLLDRAALTASTSDAWDAAEQAYQKADADLEALSGPFTDEQIDRLADLRSDAIDAIMALPAATSAQALRKIELAMFDGSHVRTGVDFPALIADARRSVVAELGNATTDPHPGWLAERNTMIEYLDSDAPTEDEANTGVGRLNEIDGRIIKTPAATTSGVFAKLLLAVQLTTEGQELVEIDAAAFVREAQALTGMGRVSPNIASMREG